MCYLGLLKYSLFFFPIIFLELTIFDFNNILLKLFDYKFMSVYCFLSYKLKIKFFFLSVIMEEKKLNSLVYFFSNLFWSEKEATEMHGVDFFEKNDDRHLLLDYSIDGNPMLKIYSVCGYCELYYNFIKMLLSYIATLSTDGAKVENKFDF